jgi:hypothetical protein
MIGLGNDEGQPDDHDFAEGQLSGPIAVGRKALIEQFVNLHPLQLRKQQRHIIHQFNLKKIKQFFNHSLSLLAQVTLGELVSVLSER